MRIIGIIQARMTSQRLPGKSMLKVMDKPVLEYLLERVRHCSSLNEIIVATSVDESDDPIADYCAKHNVNCFRGSLFDVAGRFVQVAQEYRCNAFVRINGDSPLLDQNLIDRAVSCYRDGDYDLVTNILPRTFPRGESVEVLRAGTFRGIYRYMLDPRDFENVTVYYYRNPTKFKIYNFESGGQYGNIELAIDSEKNVQVFTGIVSQMQKPHWEYTFGEILDIYRTTCIH